MSNFKTIIEEYEAYKLTLQKQEEDALGMQVDEIDTTPEAIEFIKTDSSCSNKRELFTKAFKLDYDYYSSRIEERLDYQKIK